MALPSIADVAALAGVSTGTVSNVLNRPQLVAVATRERVAAAITQLGFVRNESARVLGSGSSRAIGFVALDVGNPFFIDIARAAGDVVREVGSVVLLADSREDAEHEQANLALFAEQRVRGVLLSPVGAAKPATRLLHRVGIPAVLLDPPDQDAAACSVGTDDVDGGRQAVRHLLERGHRRLLFVGGPARLHQVRDRLAGARAELVRGASIRTVATSHLSLAAGLAVAPEVGAMVRGPKPPTAVVAANDLVALGLLHGLVAQGIGVPEQLAVVGYDDIDLAATAVVPLTSIRQPREAMGRRAAELLLDEIDAGPGHRHQQVRFRPELQVRASTGG
jgi:LacI family transcriptional regulator